MSDIVFHYSMQPEARKDTVRQQLAESAAVLANLAAARDVPAEQIEVELRLQIAWLSKAAHEWRTAANEEAAIARARVGWLRREEAFATAS